MGISFKVSKTGTRFRPRPSAVQDEGSLVGESSKESSCVLGGAGSKREAEAEDGVASVSVTSTCSGGLILPEHEVSFTLSLFQKGYFIGKPTEMENLQPLLQDGKSLHPYDRASETLFSAIESGWLPGDILDDIPSKYFDGSLVCEVRDYRKCISEQGTSVSTAEAVPVVNKVRLRMSLENVVKDIPLISDDSWTYSDLMEVESRILKALQPRLHLDPTPMLDRLCDHPSTTKLNLGIGRKKRLRQTLEVIVTSTNQTHGKKVSIDKVSENTSCKQEGQGILGYAAMQRVQENTTAQHLSSGIPSARPTNFAQETAKPALSLPSPTKIQSAINYPGMVHDRVSGLPASFSGASGNISSPQNLMGSYMDTVNGNLPLHGKRENQDAQQTPIGGIKRPKHNALGLDGIQQQQGEPQLVGLNGADLQWKNQLSHSQIDVKGIQYSTVGAQRYPPQVINNISNQENMTSFYFNQQGMRFGAKEEQADTKKLQGIEIERPLASENNALEQQQSRSQHLMLQPSMRNHLPPLTQWHTPRPLVDKDMRKDETIQKRKPAQSPRVSSGPMVQSPVSSKSGEFSSGSIGGQFNAVATTSALGSQKEKAVVNSNAAVGAPSVTSSPSDSMHRQIQASVTAKRKSNSVPKTQSMSGVGSPASVSNMTAPLNANSPSIGTAPMSDQQILERFTKFEAVTQRYQLNLKKNRVDDYPTRKATSYSSREVSFCLSNPLNGEDVMDPMKPLSRSLIGGTINTCKTRQITFVRADHTYQGVPTRIQYRLALTEKPFDGTVAMQYGDADDSDFPNTQDCLLTLPTNHHADLLAGQFCVLMERDGYQKTEDQLRPVRMGAASGSPATGPGIASDNAATEVKHPEVNRGQPSNVSAPVNTNSMGPLSSSQNLSNSGRMMSSGSGGNQAVPVSQGYLPGTAMPSRAQQLDQPMLQQQQQQLLMQQNPQSQIQQQQQLPPHIQRSSPLLSTNPLSHLMGQNTSLQMNASHMVNNKPTHLQLQMMQQQAQQQQQQQQSQLPRKMMMGLGAAMGMGNMGNNMVGLGGLGTVMGMGGVRGMSSPMGSMPGLGNVSPNQMNLGTASGFSTGLRPGSLSTAQAAAMASKLRMALHQSRAGMYGSQSGIPGMAGNSNQMLPSSAGLPMLSHGLNRANPSQLQRSTMSPMGPPKIPGPNFFLNPHQQMQLMQHQPLQQQQQQLQQQQQQQQQQISSPLQQAQMGSPQVAGSPSAMVMQQQQQQINPQQMGQQSVMSPQQLSSGVLQQMNNGGNVGAGPASPQLSTQTHGSVGSITSSPMEQQLQGTNNAGPLNNI